MNDLIILATLLVGPKHGYQLKREAGLLLGQEVMHNNTIYPLLRRFSQEGWVTKKTVSGERGQKRHQYALTRSGRETLITRLSEYSEADAKSKDAFLTRVGLFQLLDPGVRRRVLDRRAAYLQRSAEHLKEIATHFPLDVYSRETTDFLEQQVQAELDWIQYLREISESPLQRRKV
jgi:DNA-binding PadR family transcriptional regulator